MNSPCWSSGARARLRKCLSSVSFLCFVFTLEYFFVQCLRSSTVFLVPIVHVNGSSVRVFGVLFIRTAFVYILMISACLFGVPITVVSSFCRRSRFCRSVVHSSTYLCTSVAAAAWVAGPSRVAGGGAPSRSCGGDTCLGVAGGGFRLGSAGGGRLWPAGGGCPLGTAGGGALFGAAGISPCSLCHCSLDSQFPPFVSFSSLLFSLSYQAAIILYDVSFCRM